MLKYFEGEDKAFREAETNEMEVKQMKNLGYQKKPNTPTIPLYQGRAS